MYASTLHAGDPFDERIVDGFLARFGGISFRMDEPLERCARWLGLAAADPRFVLGNLGPFGRQWLRRVGRGSVGRGLLDLASGRAKVRGLVLVPHHFMSWAELESPLGRERSALCVFHVPVDGRLVPMCEVNATEIRERYYERLRVGGATH